MSCRACNLHPNCISRNGNLGVNTHCIDEDECIAGVDLSLCSEPGHADVNDFFGDISFRSALAIDTHRRQCELHRRHSRLTISTEIEVAQILGHFVAGPRRWRRDDKEDEDNKNTSTRRRSKHCVLERKYAQLRCPKPLVFD